MRRRLRRRRRKRRAAKQGGFEGHGPPLTPSTIASPCSREIQPKFHGNILKNSGTEKKFSFRNPSMFSKLLKIISLFSADFATNLRKSTSGQLFLHHPGKKVWKEKVSPRPHLIRGDPSSSANKQLTVSRKKSWCRPYFSPGVCPHFLSPFFLVKVVYPLVCVGNRAGFGQKKPWLF